VGGTIPRPSHVQLAAAELEPLPKIVPAAGPANPARSHAALASERDGTHTSAMLGTWLFLLAIALVIWIWMAALAARELAVRYGRELCRDAGVQLLDQSVSMTRLRIERIDGVPTLIRRYGFDISLDGSDRHRGHLDLRGHRLGAWSLPHAANMRVVDVIAPPRSIN
jgi:hypothetical protein